jgi:hypothetical protein
MHPTMPAERSRAASPTRQIFRPEAVRRHVQANSQAVLPRFTSPLAVACCWVLVGLLGASSGFAMFSQVPVTASGPVVVVAANVDPRARDTIALVFLPPDRAADVVAGDDVVLRFGTHTVIQPLRSIESTVTSPAALRQRFGIANDAARLITQPSIVGMIRFDALPEEMSTLMYTGATGHAEIEVASQRVASFLPVIGRYLE